MPTLYALAHYKLGPGDDIALADPEEHKGLGLFTTRARAEAAIARLVPEPGFRDWPGGFRLLEVVLDRTGWTGGFVRDRAAAPDA